MRNGYFSKAPLGPWLHVWVFYSEGLENVGGEEGASMKYPREMAAISIATAIFATTSDIDSLLKKGYITKTTRRDADPLRYAICPVFEDPTDAGIAPDQFLALKDPLEARGSSLSRKRRKTLFGLIYPTDHVQTRDAGRNLETLSQHARNAPGPSEGVRKKILC
jgi:hypothetical protein